MKKKKMKDKEILELEDHCGEGLYYCTNCHKKFWSSIHDSTNIIVNEKGYYIPCCPNCKE